MPANAKFHFSKHENNALSVIKLDAKLNRNEGFQVIKTDGPHAFYILATIHLYTTANVFSGTNLGRNQINATDYINLFQKNLF